jgi:pimeloyl-ACP methyl ester carboxylesterase
MTSAAGAAPLAFSTCRDRAPVQCADLSVPIDRANPGRGTLSLHVERIPAKGTRRGVMVLLAGGPGQAGTPMPPDDPIARAIPAYDLVMLDQRGTGKGALRCRALDDPNANESPEAVGQCAAQVGPNRAFYATRDSVLDLDDLRQGLGVESFALGGVSYGTYVTQYYAQQFPTRVSHMVLDSVVDPAYFDGFFPPTYQATDPVLGSLCGGGRCTGGGCSASNQIRLWCGAGGLEHGSCAKSEHSTGESGRCWQAACAAPAPSPGVPCAPPAPTAAAACWRCCPR